MSDFDVPKEGMDLLLKMRDTYHQVFHSPYLDYAGLVMHPDDVCLYRTTAIELRRFDGLPPGFLRRPLFKGEPTFDSERAEVGEPLLVVRRKKKAADDSTDV